MAYIINKLRSHPEGALVCRKMESRQKKKPGGCWQRVDITPGPKATYRRKICLDLRTKTETPEWQRQHSSRQSKWEAEREYRK